MHVDANENTKIYLLWGTGPKDFLITKKKWHRGKLVCPAKQQI